jgi:DNA-binding NtrC family response regulator
MKKLFFIESEIFLRQTIEKTLGAKGWQVYSSEGLEDCLYLLKDLKPELLLLDLKSLDQQEASFFKHIKDTQIPVISMGFETDKERESHFDCSFSGFIEKPLSPTDLESQLLLFLKTDKG